MMNMTFLPPQEMEQVTGLLSVLSDPKRYEALFNKLIEHDKALSEKKAGLSSAMDDYRNKVVDLETREKAIKDAKQHLDDKSKALDNLKNELDSKSAALDRNIKEHQTKAASDVASLVSLKKELENRQALIYQREDNLETREKEHSKLIEAATALKAEYEDKLKKLKAIL